MGFGCGTFNVFNGIETEGVEMTKKYSLPFRPNKKIKKHITPTHKKYNYPYAIDWAMPIGTPILAARGGTVTERESRFNVHGGEKFINRGNGLRIKHIDGECSTYWHFKWRGIVVKRGQRVRRGQLIGYSGQTGFATYPHLHFDVYKTVNGKERNLRVRFL